MGLLQSLGLRRSPGDVAGLYAAIVAQARRPDFFLSFGVPDTIGGRFDMIALHAYLVMRRLKELGGAASDGLSQALFDEMFADFDRSLREMGVGDLSVGRRVKDMAKLFYGRIKAYDEALAADSQALHDALARNAYADGTPQPDEVAALARYLTNAVARSRTWSQADLARAQVQFPAPVAN